MKLYLITNRKLAARGDLLKVIGSALEGGIDAVIIREKDLPDDRLLSLAREVKKIIGNRQVSLIINNNLEVAKTIRADGYHTSFRNFMQLKTRFDAWNGVSVHTMDEAIEAAQSGASYLLVSHIFATDCKPGLMPKGVDLIKEIKMKTNIPVIALGGINPGNCEQVLDAGADGIAVMSFIMLAANPCAAAQLLGSRCSRGE